VINDDVILDTIRRTVGEVVPDLDSQAVVPHQRLADLGCNSIDRADIMFSVMEKLSVTVPVSELHSGLSIGELSALFQKYS
jgi:polyketide biosynthesis acyl carrier protein